MINLLKADFNRVLKDKLLLVMGILAVVFAVVTPLLYVLIFSGAGIADDPMITGMVSAKAQFFSSFSIGNNLGLIAPVLLIIVLCKDFSFGTIRNKVIAGRSRSSIFISLFIVCFAVLLAVMLLHAFLTLSVCLVFFDYQATPFTADDFWYFFESLAFEILVIMFVAALLSWLCVSTKNVGLAIVMYVAIAFALVMIGSIIQIIIGTIGLMGGSESTLDVLRVIDRLNVGNAAMYIGVGTSYSLEDVLYLTLTPLAGTFCLLMFGNLKFKKRDLK